MRSLLARWWCSPVEIPAAKTQKQTVWTVSPGLQHGYRDTILREFAGSSRTRRAAADDHDLALIAHIYT